LEVINYVLASARANVRKNYKTREKSAFPSYK
jgi:hypothetical protein